MKNSNRTWWTTGAVALGGLGAVGLWWASQNAGPSAENANQVVEAQPDAKDVPLDIMRDNVATITKLEDDRRVRDFKFQNSDAGLQAEGVHVKPDGEVVVTSQQTGGSYTQQLVSAERVGTESKTVIPKVADSKARTSSAAEKSYLRFKEYFEGVDLEYTYDGKDVEEFFHLDDALVADLKQKGEGIRFNALLPGLTPENGATLLTMDGTVPMSEERLNRPPAADDPIVTAADLELNYQGHRFGLPKAVAIDGSGEKRILDRTFRFGEQGLEVAVNVPSDWLAQAQAPIVIDPSVIDSGRSIQSLTWQERNMVKDDTGRLHIAYMAVVNGRWHAMYTSGDGEEWATPKVIAEHGPAERTHYTPNLVIDSEGTLHALWADYGYGGYALEERGPYTGWAHRLHYARCPNRCQLGVWSYDGQNGGKVLTGGAGSHQLHHTMAIDGDDVAHVMFEERSPYRNRYFQVADGVASEMQTPGQTYHSNLLVVDKNNNLHAINSDYYNSYTARHWVWNRSTEEWDARAPFPRIPGAGCTAYHSHRGVSSVDKDGNIHFSNQQYLCGTWMVTYGLYKVATDEWEELGYVNLPDTTNRYHEHLPSITVDEDKTAHVFYQQNGEFYRLMYARKPYGAGWSTPVRFVRSVGTYGPPQVRPRLIYPQNSSGTPWNTVPTGLLDIMAVENGAELRYISTGAPVDGPEPFRPRDHTYVAGVSGTSTNCAPEFSWRRIPSDSQPEGQRNINYTLEVSTSPLFPTGTETKTYSANTQSSYAIPSNVLSNGNFYYWRVKASNTYGSGPYGPIFELGCDTQPPAAFNLLSPANNSDPGTKTPTFEWEAAID